MTKKITKALLTAAAPKEVAPRTFTAIASSTKLDQMGDRVLSWDLGFLKKNPVLLWMHDRKQPIGKVVTIDDRGDELHVTFKLTEGVEAADEAYALLKSGAVRALSIGFNIVGDDTVPNEEGGLNFPVAEVFEISVVSIPANRDALAAALDSPRPSARIATWEVKNLVRRELWKSAVAELCYRTGLLDEFSVVLRAKHDSKFMAQLTDIRNKIYAKADAVAASIEAMPELSSTDN